MCWLGWSGLGAVQNRKKREDTSECIDGKWKLPVARVRLERVTITKWRRLTMIIWYSGPGDPWWMRLCFGFYPPFRNSICLFICFPLWLRMGCEIRLPERAYAHLQFGNIFFFLLFFCHFPQYFYSWFKTLNANSSQLSTSNHKLQFAKNSTKKEIKSNILYLRDSIDI